jgi:fermentation-respiration switch protein FrsA (DUF1100 family)
VSAARSAGLFLAVIVAFGVVVRSTSLVERHLIFFPDKELLQNPGSRGLEFEDVYFEASDGVRLNGWYVPGPGDVTLVWFHGNAGNMFHRLDNLAQFHRRLGVNVFIFDYRGYGRSEGSPSEQGLYLDAEAAIKYLSSREDIDHRKLVLLGRSLGCAVAAEMATRHETYGVILESGFTSIQAMAGRAYPFLPGIGLFARAFIGTKLDTISKVGGIEAPLMVMHGDRDKLVPYDMGRQIFAAAGPPKRFHTIEGAGHDDGYLVGGPAYYDAVADFLRDPTGGED